MTKVFLSQPMRGKTEEDILREREEMIRFIESEFSPEIEILDSYFEDYNPENGCIPLKYLSKSLDILADADLAVFAEGWQDARGCRVEHICAVEYGITVIEMEDL